MKWIVFRYRGKLYVNVPHTTFNIHKPPLDWQQFHLRHPSAIPSIPPLFMSKPSQLSNFTSSLNCLNWATPKRRHFHRWVVTEVSAFHVMVFSAHSIPHPPTLPSQLFNSIGPLLWLCNPPFFKSHPHIQLTIVFMDLNIKNFGFTELLGVVWCMWRFAKQVCQLLGLV